MQSFADAEAVFRRCHRHVNRGDREVIRIFEMKNHNSGERAVLWINGEGKVLYQRCDWTSGWHGRFDENFDDYRRGMMRLSCTETGDEDSCVSITVVPVKPNLYSGLNVLGDTVSLRYMRTMAQCSRCGDYFISERAGNDILPDGSEPDPAWQIPILFAN